MIIIIIVIIIIIIISDFPSFLQYGEDRPSSALRALPFTDTEVEFEYTYDQAEKVFTVRHSNDAVKVVVSLAEFPPSVKVNVSTVFVGFFFFIFLFCPCNSLV